MRDAVVAEISAASWSKRKQSGKSIARCRLARKPKLRMRVKPRGSRCKRKRRRNSSTGRVMSRAMLLALLALRSAELRRKPAGNVEVPQIHSLAVLPLANLSNDPNQEYFSDGLTDALITDLAQFGSVKVVSRTSTLRYKDTKKLLPEIAQELNVDAIVEGTVQRSGDRVRITAQLIHGPSDKHLWAKSYERDSGDVFALERSEEHTSELQSQSNLVCRLLLEKKKQSDTS